MIVSKASKKGKPIYNWLMKTKNCKILALSGTPIINFSYELALLGNILRGPMNYKTNIANNTIISSYTPLFPEDESEFDDIFIDYELKTSKNEEIFKRRFMGLVSYYYGQVGSGFPDVEIYERKLEMSNYQFALYDNARKYEIEKDKKSKVSNKVNKDSGKKEMMSTFRNYSRQISNVAPPYPTETDIFYELKVPLNFEEWGKKKSDDSLDKLKEYLSTEQIANFARDYNDAEEEADKIDILLNLPIEQLDEDEPPAVTLEFIKEMKVKKGDKKLDVVGILKFDSLRYKSSQEIRDKLEDYSPKINDILNTIENGPGSGGKVFIYSHYRAQSGIGALITVLKAFGYEEINDTNIDTLNPATIEPGKRFGYFVGGIDKEKRDKIREFYNHDRNMNGELMKVFMGTQSAAEGISLKHVQQVFVMEPYWNKVRITQVIGRARRMDSHKGLPKSKHIVHVFMYQATISNQRKKKTREQLTTDEDMERIATNKQIINSPFIELLKTSSTDCGLNFAHNLMGEGNQNLQCFVPPEQDNKVAWFPDIQKDIQRLRGVKETHKKITYKI